MKSLSWTKLGIAMIALLLVAWSVLELTSSPPEKTGPARVDANTCPDCGSKLSKTGECLKCMADLGPEEYRARKRARASGSGGKLIPIVLVGLLVLLLTVHFGFIVHRRVRQNKEVILYYYYCPKCQRKLRYRDTQAGKASQCPVCKRPFMFPQPNENPKGSIFRALSGRVRHFFSPRTPQE